MVLCTDYVRLNSYVRFDNISPTDSNAWKTKLLLFGKIGGDLRKILYRVSLSYCDSVTFSMPIRWRYVCSWSVCVYKLAHIVQVTWVLLPVCSTILSIKKSILSCQTAFNGSICLGWKAKVLEDKNGFVYVCLLLGATRSTIALTCFEWIKARLWGVSVWTRNVFIKLVTKWRGVPNQQGFASWSWYIVIIIHFDSINNS